jgi:hypothetical protein
MAERALSYWPRRSAADARPSQEELLAGGADPALPLSADVLRE